MLTTVLTVSTKRSFIALGALVLAATLGKSAQAQTTYTWDAVGNGNGSMGDPLNWQPNGVPNFGATSNGDSLIFSSSTNTAVMMTDDSAGDQVANITFDANAPAYTFTAFPDHSDNDFAIRGGTLSNQSAHTQDFTGTVDVYFPSSTLNLAGGDPTTNLSVKMTSLIFNGSTSKLTGTYDATINDFTGTSATVQFSMLGSGRLYVTGDGTLDSRGGIGILNIGTSTSAAGPYGAVQISNSNALGAGGSTTSNYTRIYGNINSNGSLELTNNITTNEGILMYGRGNGNGTGSITYDNALNPSIVNVSGNNTMTGPFSVITGGGNYNFASNSGSLTITSNFLAGGGGVRTLTNQGAGNTTFSGNVGNTNAGGALSIVQLGGGTLTLGGTANVGIENIFVNSGTIAFGANAAFSYDLTGLQSIFVQNNSTLDVSAVSGGYNSNASLQGTGNVLGNVHMNSGFQVAPNNGYTLVDGSATSFNNVVGQLNFHNDLDLSAGATMVWKLGALTTSGPGTNFDQLTVGGNLTLGGSSALSIDLTSLLSGAQQPGGGDPFWSSSHTWTIISNSSNPTNSNFVSIVNGVVATGTFTTSVSSGALLGDVNGDHVVNGLDIAVVASHWLLTGATLGQGDANGDGTVNGLDIALIASHWLSTGGGSGGGILLTYTPSAGGGTAVPEPSTFVLAGVGLTGLLIARRRRS